MTAGAFPPTAEEWDEQSRWDVFKQVLDSVVGVLAAPLSLTALMKAAPLLAAKACRSKRKRKRQMQSLRKIGNS